MAVKMGQQLKALSTKAEFEPWSTWEKVNKLSSVFWSLQGEMNRTKNKEAKINARNQA